jgi:hypothetical protein
MSQQSFIKSIGDVVAFSTSSSISAADATNSAQQAVAAKATTDQIIATATAANDLFGVVTGGMQRILQEFAPTSTEAASLLGKAGAISSTLGLALAAQPILDALRKRDPGSITTGQLDGLAGAALMAGAVSVSLPEVAVILTTVGSLMVAAAIFDNNSSNTLSNAVTQLKKLIQPYYSQLSTSDQAVFANTMSNAMASTLSGGMLVPEVNDAGWVTAYRAEESTSVSRNGNGTSYTFGSGATYIIGHVTDDDPLETPSDITGKSVWTVPGADVNNPLTLDIHQGGTYSSRFTDPQGNAVTEIYIAGSSETFTVGPSSGDYRFIYVAGNNDQVAIHGDNNQVFVADNNRISIDGANNVVHARGDTTIEFGSGDGNAFYNEVSGENLTVVGDNIEITGALNGGCGGEEVVLGVSNRLKFYADGSKTLTLQYNDDDRLFHRTYNAEGVQVELLAIRPDGSYAHYRYSPLTGLTTQLMTAGSDGSGMMFRYNDNQQLIETDYLRTSGPGTQFLKDPVTGQTTAMNTIFGLLPAANCDPATDVITWSSRGFGATSLSAVQSDNPQIALAASTH